jgi:hypothetical protein
MAPVLLVLACFSDRVSKSIRWDILPRITSNLDFPTSDMQVLGTTGMHNKGPTSL